MTLTRFGSVLTVQLLICYCHFAVMGLAVNQSNEMARPDGGKFLAPIGILIASVVALVVAVVTCLCCYRRQPADDSDSDEHSKHSDDQETGLGSFGADERKQLTMQSRHAAKKNTKLKDRVNFPWPISESSIAVKGVQPDQGFGLSSLNKALGVSSPDSMSLSSPQGGVQRQVTGLGFAEGSSDASRGSDLSSPLPRSPYGSPEFGRIQFRLGYDFQQMTLTLKLICAVELPAKDFSGTSDPYVKIYLLPDRKHKLTSNIKRKCLNPHWNEVFTFEGFPYSKLVNKSLYMQVLDYDRFSRDDPIGEVVLPLNDIDLLNGETLWRDLLPCKGHVGRLGELLVSLCYNSTKGQIIVNVVKARQLKAKDINGLSDPYAKVWLMIDGKKVQKRKTKVHPKTLDPVFNDFFVFDVPFETIRHASLLISVMDHDLIGTNDLIGQILLGCKSSPQEAKHWNEMLTKPRKAIEKWHMLKDLG